MSQGRLRISLKGEPSMVVNRISIDNHKLVYVICANRRVAYPKGSSAVVYIGTTKNGIYRVAESAAFRSESVLTLHGVNSFKVRIVTCDPLRGVRTWHQLERAFLLEFKRKYGSVPLCNTIGKNIKDRGEFRYFTHKRIRDILHDLESSVVPSIVISDAHDEARRKP